MNENDTEDTASDTEDTGPEKIFADFRRNSKVPETYNSRRQLFKINEGVINNKCEKSYVEARRNLRRLFLCNSPLNKGICITDSVYLFMLLKQQGGSIRCLFYLCIRGLVFLSGTEMSLTTST